MAVFLWDASCLANQSLSQNVEQDHTPSKTSDREGALAYTREANI